MMLMYKREYYLARTDRERLWYTTGIPFRFWRADVPELHCLTVQFDDTPVTPRIQQQWLQSLRDPSGWGRPALVVIGSTPTDDTALHVVFDVVKEMVTAQRNVVVQNFASAEMTEVDDETHCLVGYNILLDSTPQRIQLIRDWTELHRSTTCVLVVAGNPLEFALNRLHCNPDAVILLDDTRTTLTNRA